MRRALTLIDMLVAMGILSIALMVTLPTMSSSERSRLDAAANLLASDFEHAVALSVTEPSDPIVVVIHDKGAGYHLARLSDPETPIPKHEGPAAPEWSITFGQGAAAVLAGVKLEPVGEFTSIAYDSFGRLLAVEDREIVVTNQGGNLLVTVEADTGDVTVSLLE